MICPQCEGEYRFGFVRCSECGVSLVDHLPEIADDPREAYVKVKSVEGPLEESQVRSFLEANGIPSQVQSEGWRRVYGITVTGTEILVPASLAARAMDLLLRADRGELDLDEGTSY